MTRWLVSFINSQVEKSSSTPSDGRLLDILDSLRQGETEDINDQHDHLTSSVVSLVHSEESPSCDYHMEHTEEENQSDHKLDIDKGNCTLRQGRMKRFMSASTQKGSNDTELSSYFSQDENIMKPLLEEGL